MATPRSRRAAGLGSRAPAGFSRSRSSQSPSPTERTSLGIVQRSLRNFEGEGEPRRPGQAQAGATQRSWAGRLTICRAIHDVPNTGSTPTTVRKGKQMQAMRTMRNIIWWTGWVLRQRHWPMKPPPRRHRVDRLLDGRERRPPQGGQVPAQRRNPDVIVHVTPSSSTSIES